MEPLSLKTRRSVGYSFILLFIIILPIAVLYASGYRLSGHSLVSTGGVFIAVPVANADVLLNGEKVGTSGFLDKSFFIDNLAPGSYAIQVNRPGYYPWSKTLIVQRSLVTAVNAFLVPQNIALLEVVAGGASEDAATTTYPMSFTVYRDVQRLFEDTETTATSTAQIENSEKSRVVIREGNVSVRWEDNLLRAPDSFCIAPGACVVEVSVERDSPEVTRADFFKGGVVYQTKETGIYFAEVDVKSPQVVVPFSTSPGAEFRLFEGSVYIRDGDVLYRVSDF